MALALGRQAGRDVDPAARLHVDVPALVGADAGALDVAADAEADPATLGCGLLPVCREVVPADERLELGQGCREVAGVVLQRPAVLEHQPLVVGHLLGLDEVARAHLGAVEAELGRDGVHRALHRVAALRAAGAAVGRHENGVGVQRPELDAVGAGLVGAEQLGGRDDRDDDAVGHVGAVVVPEPHVEGEQAPLVVEPDRDLLHLAALVRAGDEVLAAVLGPLHVATELARRPRHEHLLGPRVHDLDAEPAAHVGGDALDLRERHAQLGGDGGAHPGRGLRGGVEAQRCSSASQRAKTPLPSIGMQALRSISRSRVRVCGAAAMAARDVADLLQQVGATLPGTSSCTSASPARALSMPTTTGSCS